jgi:bla regulator protein blaR1
LGIQKEVKALLSVYVDTPQVIGFIKPVILLPASCLTNLTTAQLEAVLLHELVHIKRNDYLVNLFVASLEILFFFNPFVKQLAASIRQEREYDCDDKVLQFQHPPHHYAAALLTLEKSRLLPVTYGIAASGKNQQQLLTRIQRIMGIQNKETGAYRLTGCVLVLLFLAFMTTIKPGKMTIDKFGSAGLSLAANNVTNLQYNDEAAEKISNASQPAGARAVVMLRLEKALPASPLVLPAPEEIAIAQPTVGMMEEEDIAADGTIQIAASREAVDFSLQQKNAAAAIIAGEEEAAEPLIAAPYVAANSFSYQFFQDTISPKVKGETYNERVAKESLTKARKALEQIDWQKIEKQLKYKNQDIAKLKKELDAQIQGMNWQKISKEVQSALAQEQLDKLQQAAQLDRTMQQYRQAETYYEALQKQMAEQEQALKATEERAQDSQRAAESQRKKLQQEMKKRRIIYI